MPSPCKKPKPKQPQQRLNDDASPPAAAGRHSQPEPPRSSLADRARIFDQSYEQKSPRKQSNNKQIVDNKLQELLDASEHRKQANVIHGRKKTHRDASNPGTAATILSAPIKDDYAKELKALMDASQHRKTGTHISDGVKPVYHPIQNKVVASSVYSIVPRGSVVKPKPFAQGSANIQKLLDASQHKKLLQTSSAHRLAHKMMMPADSFHPPAFTFHLRKVKNRIKPALPEGVEPLKPTETTFQNVQAPKLRVDIQTFQAPIFLKTPAQQRLLIEAMTAPYVLKRHTPATQQALLKAMEPVDLRTGDVLQRQGECREEDDQWYVVAEGQVQVKVDGKVVDTIAKGQTFGQERLLVRKQNEATIVAVSSSGSGGSKSGASSAKTKLFRLNQTTFRAILQQEYRSVVLEELKQKTPKAKEWSTPSIRGTASSSYDEDDGEEDDWEESSPRPHDDDDDGNDDLDSFHADAESSVDAHSFFDDIASRTTSKTNTTKASAAASSSSRMMSSSSSIIIQKPGSSATAFKKPKQRRPQPTICNFETSPIFQHQEALRRSVQKYASSKNDDLEFIKVLGEGQFGEVWLVAATLPDQDPTRQEFALKIQKLGDSDYEEDGEGASEQETKDAILNEIKVLQNLHYPFIVNLVHTYESEGSMDMLLGLIPGGELWDKIHREQEDGSWISGIPEGWARFYAYVLTDTLGFIHSRGYIFRDLKPENIMLDQDGYPIIVDFGFAKFVEPGSKTFTFCGTPNYVAPEIITNEGHSKEADYWALGVVIYEMVSGENPFFFDGMEQSALYQAITEEDPYEMSDNVTASDQVRELTDLLLIKNPEERLGRPGAQEILEHVWFRGMPDLSEIHAKRVDPQQISERIFDDVPESSEMDDLVTFMDMDETEHLETVHQPAPSSPVQIELPKGFGMRSNSFEEARPPKDLSVKSLRRHSVDNIALFDEEKDGTEDEACPIMNSPTMTYIPSSPKTIKFWTPRKKGLGYFVNMKSPEERQSSKTRRSVVNDFLSQYLEDIGLDDEFTKRAADRGVANSQFNASCPSFFR